MEATDNSKMADIADAFRRAHQCKQRGDIAKARDIIREAVERHPDNAELHDQLGRYYSLMNEYELAVEASDRAIQLDPYNPKFHANRGTRLLRMGRLAEADESARHALRIDPAYPSPYILLRQIERAQDATIKDLRFSDRQIFEAAHWRARSDALSEASCRQRFIGYRRVSRNGLSIAIVVAITAMSVLPNTPFLIKLLLAVLAGVGTRTAIQAFWLARYHSFWRITTVLLVSSAMLGISLWFSWPTVSVIIASVALSGGLTPHRLQNLLQGILISVGSLYFGLFSLVSFVLRLSKMPDPVNAAKPFTQYHGIFRNVFLWHRISAYREAVARGELIPIYTTTLKLVEHLGNTGRVAEIPLILDPILELARETDSIPQYAEFGVLRSWPFGVHGNLQEGIALLKDCFERANDYLDSIRNNSDQRHIVALQSTLANNLMVMHQELGDYEEALSWGQIALENATVVAQFHSNPAVPDPTVLVHLNLADLILDANKDPDSAIPHIEATTKQLEWMKSTATEEYALMCLVKTKIRLKSDQFVGDTERENLKYALTTYIKQGNLKFAAEVYLWMSVLEARLGNLGTSRHLLEEAQSLDDQALQSVFPACADDTKVAFIASIRRRTDAYLSLVLTHFLNDPVACETAFVLCMRRKGLSSTVQITRKNMILSGRYPKQRGLLDEHTSLSRQIALLARGASSIDDEQQIERLKKRQEALETELSYLIPEFRMGVLTGQANRQTIARLLNQDAVLIEFLRISRFDFSAAYPDSEWCGTRYIAFVLDSSTDSVVRLVDLGDGNEIDRTIADFRAAISQELGHDTNRHLTPISTKSTVHHCESLGRRVRATIFDPLVPAMNQRKRVLIAPDGYLALLPFEVLPQNDGRYIIDDYHVSYLGTAHDLLHLKSDFSDRSTVPLVFADPDFDLQLTPADQQVLMLEEAIENQSSHDSSRDLARSTLYFQRLPGTRSEGEEVARLLGIQPLLEGTALEATLKACHSPTILHIATHGFFQSDPDNQSPGLYRRSPLLRAGLALAGANTHVTGGSLPEEAEDGVITAEDVSGLDLLATELVVLSACETGLGDIQIGEGVFGLRRAFVLAGAKTLIMSLWKVPDSQTDELMRQFYAHVLGGQSRADALRTAQLTIRAKYPALFYWGAFICQGNSGALPSHCMQNIPGHRSNATNLKVPT